MRVSTSLALAAAAALLAPAPAARACSVCLCGDPVAASVGLQPPISGTWTFTLENRSLSKSNALEDDPTGSEFEHEDRVTGSAAYAVSDHVIIGATVPFLDRRIVQNPAGARTNTARFGDADLLARIDLASHRQTRRFTTLKLLGSVGPPTGANSITGVDGVRLDQHAQAGTGAWAGSMGLGGLTRGMQYWIYASGVYRATTRNSQGYKYGNSFLLTAEIGRKMSSAVSVILGVAGRSTGHDTNNPDAARIVEDSGGRIAFAAPAVQFKLSERSSIRTEAHLPVWQDLHGTQNEDANLIFRFTYSP